MPTTIARQLRRRWDQATETGKTHSSASTYAIMYAHKNTKSAVPGSLIAFSHAARFITPADVSSARIASGISEIQVANAIAKPRTASVSSKLPRPPSGLLSRYITPPASTQHSTVTGATNSTSHLKYSAAGMTSHGGLGVPPDQAMPATVSA